MEKNLEKARQLLQIEARVISELKDRLDQRFQRAIEIIYQSNGKVIVIGMGKSGLVGRKIAATFSSTGTPSFFIHAGEAAHGDLGGISENDILLIVSNSGETEEIVKLLPSIKKTRIPTIGLIGKPASTLATKCDVVISTQVRQEACPLGIVPTASAIATTALGDALAIALLDRRGFEKKDFASLHPGGILGRRLMTTVSDLMHVGDTVPLARKNETMKDILFVMTEKGLGVVGIVNMHNELEGVITDGDLRRGLEKTNDFLNKYPETIMSTRPKWIKSSALAIDALRKMEKHAITILFVYEKNKSGPPTGIIHIHDILKHGIMS